MKSNVQLTPQYTGLVQTVTIAVVVKILPYLSRYVPEALNHLYSHHTLKHNFSTTI